jgi:hypothetical protein
MNLKEVWYGLDSCDRYSQWVSSKWVAGAFSLGVKWPGHEADHSPPSTAEVKNTWSYNLTQ